MNLAIEFSLFDLLILLGILQGVIVSLLLFNSKRNRRGNKFLALGLLSFCLLSTKPLLHTLSLWDTHFFMYFPNAIELALAPLIYFFVKALLTPKFKFKAKHWLHFIPFFLSQSYSFIVYFSVLQTTHFSEKRSIAEALLFDKIKLLDEYILVLMIFVYLFHGYKLLMIYKYWLENNLSDTSIPDFKWLINLFQVFAFTAVILLFGRFLSLLSSDDYLFLGDYYWRFISLYIAFLIYFLGLKGYLQPNFVLPEREGSQNYRPLSSKGVSNEIPEKIMRAINQELLFLDSKLSIQSFSSHLGLTQREVSQTINQHFNTNFRDFINNYRIEEVKSKIINSNYSHMSILGIAMESGFNSEASFYRLFKKHTGLTPKEYLLKQNIKK